MESQENPIYHAVGLQEQHKGERSGQQARPEWKQDEAKKRQLPSPSNFVDRVSERVAKKDCKERHYDRNLKWDPKYMEIDRLPEELGVVFQCIGRIEQAAPKQGSH